MLIGSRPHWCEKLCFTYDIGIFSTIATGINIGVAGLEIFIDGNTTAWTNEQSRFTSQLDIWSYANSNNYHLRRYCPFISLNNSNSFCSFYRNSFFVKIKIDTGFENRFLHQISKLFIQHLGQYPVLHFYNANLDALFMKSFCQLHANQPGTNDNGVRYLVDSHFFLDCMHVPGKPEIVYSFKSGTWDR